MSGSKAAHEKSALSRKQRTNITLQWLRSRFKTITFSLLVKGILRRDRFLKWGRLRKSSLPVRRCCPLCRRLARRVHRAEGDSHKKAIRYSKIPQGRRWSAKARNNPPGRRAIKAASCK